MDGIDRVENKSICFLIQTPLKVFHQADSEAGEWRHEYQNLVVKISDIWKFTSSTNTTSLHLQKIGLEISNDERNDCSLNPIPKRKPSSHSYASELNIIILSNFEVRAS